MWRTNGESGEKGKGLWIGSARIHAMQHMRVCGDHRVRNDRAYATAGSFESTAWTIFYENQKVYKAKKALPVRVRHEADRNPYVTASVVEGEPTD